MRSGRQKNCARIAPELRRSAPELRSRLHVLGDAAALPQREEALGGRGEEELRRRAVAAHARQDQLDLGLRRRPPRRRRRRLHAAVDEEAEVARDGVVVARVVAEGEAAGGVAGGRAGGDAALVLERGLEGAHGVRDVEERRRRRVGGRGGQRRLEADVRTKAPRSFQHESRRHDAGRAHGSALKSAWRSSIVAGSTGGGAAATGAAAARLQNSLTGGAPPRAAPLRDPIRRERALKAVAAARDEAAPGSRGDGPSIGESVGGRRGCTPPLQGSSAVGASAYCAAARRRAAAERDALLDLELLHQHLQFEDLLLAALGVGGGADARRRRERRVVGRRPRRWRRRRRRRRPAPPPRRRRPPPSPPPPPPPPPTAPPPTASRTPRFAPRRPLGTAGTARRTMRRAASSSAGRRTAGGQTTAAVPAAAGRTRRRASAP